jgi:hypothetical protein
MEGTTLGAGTYVSFMAANGSAAADPARLNPTGAGAIWLRPDGVQPFASVSALFTSSPVLRAPVAQASDGTYYQYTNPIIVGGTNDPTVPGTMANTCNNWTSVDSAQSVVRTNALSVGNLFNNSTSTCDGAAQFLCVQQ